MKDLEQLERKSLQTNKTTQSIAKKKSTVPPTTSERKVSTISSGSNSKNVNY